jgi:hypothetical protein
MADWIDAKGRRYKPSEMENGHLANTLAYLERAAKEMKKKPWQIHPAYNALRAEAISRWGRWGDSEEIDINTGLPLRPKPKPKAPAAPTDELQRRIAAIDLEGDDE